MTGTVAPGRQRVIALKKRMFLVIDSPMINVVGGKRGERDVTCGQPGQDSVRPLCITSVTVGAGRQGRREGLMILNLRNLLDV